MKSSTTMPKAMYRLAQKEGLSIGKLTAQHKGGTPDPTSFKFKIKPLDIFNS